MIPDRVIARAAPPPERRRDGPFTPVTTNDDSFERRKSRLCAAFGSLQAVDAHAESIGIPVEDWWERFRDVVPCGPEPDWACAVREIHARLRTGPFPFSEVRRFGAEQLRSVCPRTLRLSGDALEGPLDYLASRLSMALHPTTVVDETLGRSLEWSMRFESSPTLAYVVGRIFVDWSVDMRRILERAACDQRPIARTFFACEEPGRLLRIECGLGDPHMGGRSVAILRFERGSVVFKPKDLRVAGAIGEIASRMEAVSLSAPHLLLRDGYAWERYYEHHPLGGFDEAKTFYRSLGGWTYLLQALGGIDFWFDNLIAAGAIPQFVDFETGIQPAFEWPGAMRPLVGIGDRSARSSPLAVGILPLLLPTREGEDPVDIGCLSVPGTFRTPIPDIETGGLVSLEETRFAPHYRDGTFVDAAECFDAFEEGYLEAARELAAPALQGAVVDRLVAVRDATVRIIPVDTWTFYRTLFRSFSPRYLSDSAWREIELHALVSRAGTLVGPLREATVRDLRRADIPFYRTRLDSRDLLGAEGERLKDYYRGDSIRAVRERLELFAGIDDGERRAWLRSGFSLRADNPPHRNASRSADASASAPDLLCWAEEIAEGIKELAVCNDHGAPTWIGLVHDVFRGTRLVGPLGFDVLSGRAGIGLALTGLAQALGRADLATLASETLAGTARDIRNHPWLFLASGAGHGVGLGGLVAALARVPDLVPTAREVFEFGRTSEVWMYSGSDLVSGLAGWRLAASALGEPSLTGHGPERAYAPSAIPRLACWLDPATAPVPNLDRRLALAMRRDFDRHGTWFAERWLDDRHNLSGIDGLAALAIRFTELAADGQEV